MRMNSIDASTNIRESYRIPTALHVTNAFDVTYSATVIAKMLELDASPA